MAVKIALVHVEKNVKQMTLQMFQLSLGPMLFQISFRKCAKISCSGKWPFVMSQRFISHYQIWLVEALLFSLLKCER